MRKRTSQSLLATIALATLAQTGCVGTTGIDFGPLGVPIPVSPYFQKREEDKFWIKERYDRVPVLGPITAGGPPEQLDPPSDDEVMRSLEKVHPVQAGIPLLWERQRNNVRIIKTPIAEYVDPVRFYPLVGPAQQHHKHYKCTIYYSDRVFVGWPLPHMLEDEDSQEVIYIDHNHLHMAGDVDTGLASNY